MNKETIATIAAILIISAGLFLRGGISKTDELKEAEKSGDIVSAEGIHWHPILTISIKGEKQLIPGDVGIGAEYASRPLYDPIMGMADIHTHDDSGILHWEIMNGPVKRDDLRIGQFFEVWGKPFNSSCIFDKCSGPDGKVSFKVNGEKNADFENYLIKDGDKIEINYD